MKLKIYMASIVWFFCCQLMHSQQEVVVKKDSIKLYREIEKYAGHSKFRRFVYRLLFRPVPYQSVNKTIKNNTKKGSVYAPYEGKAIRKITIETLDPFGYSVVNSTDKPSNWFERLGNRSHVKSKQWTIRNFLLFRSNDCLDSLLLKESERLLQSQRFIRRAIIIPVEVAHTPDSVDVTIRVLDSWSLIPTGSISATNGNLQITERNFLGLGHEVKHNFKQQLETKQNGYAFGYSIPNFKNTYINTRVGYAKELNDDYTKEIAIERSFFSPYTRWAGGLNGQQRLITDSLPNRLNQMALSVAKFNYFDAWGGHSFPLFKGKQEEKRITNLVTTLRYTTTNYLQVPDSNEAYLNYFANSYLYLASMGLTRRKFIEDSYLFNYGIPEYVQTGQTIAITTGWENKNQTHRSYFGGRFAFGDYFPLGYFGFSAAMGSFFRDSTTEQTTFSLDINYFTDLFDIGRWKIRQFFQSQLVVGNNRMPIKYDLININEDNGIQGFNSAILGTKKWVLTFQTQSYSPGMLWGFRLSPFLNATLGMIGDSTRNLLENRLYSKLGVGILLSNDYLVFNNFQLSLAYYPTIPGMGEDLFKTNSFNNNDLRLIDYQVGPPAVVSFR